MFVHTYMSVPFLSPVYTWSLVLTGNVHIQEKSPFLVRKNKSGRKSFTGGEACLCNREKLSLSFLTLFLSNKGAMKISTWFQWQQICVREP